MFLPIGTISGLSFGFEKNTQIGYSLNNRELMKEAIIFGGNEKKPYFEQILTLYNP
jgi:hypothetical protein